MIEEGEQEIIEEVEYLGKLTDPRKERVINNNQDIIKDHEELETEIDSIKDKRNKIITLQLYIERSIDRIISLINISNNFTFAQKIKFLADRNFIDSNQLHNLTIIKELRNDYAHKLNIENIEAKYLQLLKDLKLSGYISANPHYDKFQLIVHQILFELNDMYDKENAKKGQGKVEKGLTDKKIKEELEKVGKLFWQFCKILRYEKEGYIEIYHLQCPYCNKGEIIREKDGTPGFKESSFIECTKCGLGGDGSNLKLESIKK